MGDHGAGKTSLIRQYVFKSFGEGAISKVMARESLKYINFTPKNIIGTIKVRMSINDIGNVRHPRELENMVLDNIDGILLVCDLTREDTYLSFNEWLDYIKEMPTLSAIILAGNKADTALKDREVELEELQTFAKAFNTRAIATSARTGDGVEDAFMSLARRCMALELGEVGGIIQGEAAGTAAHAREDRASGARRAAAGAQPPRAKAPSKPEYTQAQLRLRELRMKHVQQKSFTGTSRHMNAEGEVHLKYGGYCYLIKEERPDVSFRAFCELLESGHDGMCIARQYPDEIQEYYEMGNTPVYWLTRSGTEKHHLSVNLSRLSSFIKKFIDETKSPVLMVEGLEYLIIQNDFMSVLKFVQLINEYIRMKHACLVIPLNPEILGDRDMSLIEREMVVIEARE